MKKKEKILVTGSDGQLGRSMREIAGFYPEWEFVFTDIGQLDITDSQAVMAYVSQTGPKWIVNAAAYTAVEKAEEDAAAARRLNADAVGNLVAAAAAAGASLVHISTDYVYPGDDPGMLTEESATGPLSVYGKTKLEGERIALGYGRCTVLRTGWLYSEFGRNFVKTMRSLASLSARVDVVGDEWGSPTSAHDLAKAVMTVVENPHYGLFNFSGEGIASRALFAEEIFSQSGMECRVNHIASADYPSKASRPSFAIMSKGKFSRTFKVDIPEWESSLQMVIQRLDEMEHRPERKDSYEN